ncbi:MAG: DUF58 domain-containing protein [Syntrophaceae bacterium]|nr:DUF58 domain-containing protein [Syntrophaceae bacterium]
MLDALWLLIIAVLDIWAIWTGNSLLILVTSLTWLLTVSVWLWNRWSLVGVEFSRRLSDGRAYFGQQIDLSLILVNLKPLPLPWLLVEDEIPQRLTVENGKIEIRHDGFFRCLQNILPMMPYERVVRRFPVMCSRRGIHTFGPAHLESGDYLGFLKSHAGVSATDTLVVFPRIAPVAMDRLSSNTIIGQDPLRRILHTDPVRTVSAREYIAGDPYRMIDWRTTARTGGLMVRVYEPSTTPLVDIVLNFSVPSYISRDVEPDETEFIISVGASLASHAAARGWAVGLRANGRSRRRPIAAAPSAAPAQLGEILDILAQAYTVPTESIFSVLTATHPARPAGASVVLITTVLNENITGALENLQRRGQPVTVVHTAVEPEAEADIKSAVPVWRLPYAPNWTEHEAYIVHR